MSGWELFLHASRFNDKLLRRLFLKFQMDQGFNNKKTFQNLNMLHRRHYNNCYFIKYI